MTSNLKTLLGIEQFNKLREAIRSAQLDFKNTRQISPALLFITLAVALVPLLAHSVGKFYSFDIISILIGSSALISWIAMRRMGISFLRRDRIYQDIKLTHYAFAFGCIPGVLILLFVGFDSIKPTEVLSKEGLGLVETGIFARVVFITLVALWAAITEELIFRALLIGVVRRLSLFSNQSRRDLFAILISSAIFALSHAISWGPLMGLALLGIGIGLGFAFVASREHIFPLIVYHCLFDILSLTAIFLYK